MGMLLYDLVHAEFDDAAGVTSTGFVFIFCDAELEGVGFIFEFIGENE